MAPWGRARLLRVTAIAGVACLVIGVIGVVGASLLPGPPAPLAPDETRPTSPVAIGPTSPPSEPSHEPSVPVPSTFDPEPPVPTPGPSQSVEAIPPGPIPSGRIATRVTVEGLGIDLPVTRQTTEYPACGVAMYLMELAQPGQGGVTYLYAHAQAGNFLPIYRESLVNDGARMIGMAVDVYTGDSLRFSYRIVEVRRHVTSLAGAFAWRGESVFLQTSEGPGASTPKLQVVAEHVATAAAGYEAAHPPPRPVTCQ